jgi:hypothetical protein
MSLDLGIRLPLMSSPHDIALDRLSGQLDGVIRRPPLQAI